MQTQSLYVPCLGHKMVEIRKAIHLQTFGEINPPIDEKLGQEMHLMETIQLQGRPLPLIYLPLEYESTEKPVIYGTRGDSPPSEAEQFLLGKTRATLLFHRLAFPETLISLPTALQELLDASLVKQQSWFALVGIQFDTDDARKSTNRTIEQVQRKLADLIGDRRVLIEEHQIQMRTKTKKPWINRGQLDPVIHSLLDALTGE
ncbi:MAG: hypothetical protein ACFFGZ_13145 [Candidatus Thorarchaeota archaeon]